MCAHNMGSMDTIERDAEIQELVEFLAEPIKEVRLAFDSGISYAEMKLAGERKDPWLWANLARFNAHEALVALNPEGWSVAGLANCGVKISKGHLTVRVLKRFGSGAPHPGSNQARKAFWSQMTPEPPLPLLVEGRLLRSAVHLILDWDAGADQKVNLELVKPVGAWKYLERQRVEWAVGLVVGNDEKLSFVGAHEPLDIDSRYDAGELQAGD